jgi:preprotein translocase subunit SecD
MLIFSKLKIFLISSLCLLAIYFALPTFLLNNEDVLKNTPLKTLIPNNKVNLGLDLRGGSQLLLEIDVENYILEQVEILKEEIKNVLKV